MLQKRLDNKIYDYYERFNTKRHKFLEKTVAPIARLGIPADVFSLIGLISGILAVISVHHSHTLFIVFILLNRLIDGIDGTIAKLNKKEIFKGANLDHICDNTFSVLLFLTFIPIVGPTLPLLTVGSYLLHLIFDIGRKGESFLVPRSDYAQIFFAFKLYKEGLIIQIIFMIIQFLSARIIYGLKTRKG